MRNLTPAEIAEFSDLDAEFNRRRNAHIARDGEIRIDRQYPDLDEISSKMFRILSGGTDHIVLTDEWIVENATEIVVG